MSLIRQQITPWTQVFGKLSASPTIANLTILDPQVSVPSVSGWQPFPVDTLAISSNTTAPVPTNATFVVPLAGTYQVAALLTLQYPNPGSDGPDDISGYCIGVVINDVLQNDAIGSTHISTEGGHENPGLLFSASLSGTYTLPVNSTIQFVIQGTTSTDSPQYMVVASANATINRIGN